MQIFILDVAAKYQLPDVDLMISTAGEFVSYVTRLKLQALTALHASLVHIEHECYRQ